MKSPETKAEKAFFYGKAESHLRKIEKIFVALDKENSRLLEAIVAIDEEIDKGINSLNRGLSEYQ